MDLPIKLGGREKIARAAIFLIVAVFALMLLLSRSGGDNAIPVVDIKLVGFTNREGRIDGAFLMLSNASSLNLIRRSSYTVDSSGGNSVDAKSHLISPSSFLLAPGQVEMVETMCPERGDKWVVTFGFHEEIGLPIKVSRYLRKGIVGRDSTGESALYVYISPPISRPEHKGTGQ